MKITLGHSISIEPSDTPMVSARGYSKRSPAQLFRISSEGRAERIGGTGAPHIVDHPLAAGAYEVRANGGPGGGGFFVSPDGVITVHNDERRFADIQALALKMRELNVARAVRDDALRDDGVTPPEHFAGEREPHNGAKRMRSKFPGRCDCCGLDFASGTEIFWTKYRVVHVQDCKPKTASTASRICPVCGDECGGTGGECGYR